eukprot:CAMPEP_0119057144 /NCGR_PEP_ID=MMETSP1178-20130426/1667_1 /TAXON_ID=33656 /ORGANISM="unid sp, Strain CCMP2000" /LENGTH=73 /DNA_ID=CAMNT_0007037945 /DNA_START=285 /DNA_END=502 /DNA_ORIENTATION=+
MSTKQAADVRKSTKRHGGEPEHDDALACVEQPVDSPCTTSAHHTKGRDGTRPPVSDSNEDDDPPPCKYREESD